MSIDWETIRKDNAPQMWSVAWRILKHEADALDCCQDVFTEVVANSHSGDRKEINNWPAYLKWLTTQRAIDLLRQKHQSSRATLLGEADVLQADQTISAESELRFKELTDWVRSQLAEMPEEMATAFWLVCVEELSYQEVAHQTGMSTNAIGVHIHRARKKLKQQLKSQSLDSGAK